MGQYKIVEKVRPLAYKLALPSESTSVHNVFKRLYCDGIDQILVM